MPERVFLDRIEGDTAILLAGPEGREKISLPRRLLPSGTREGAALDLTVTTATGDTTHQEIDGLMSDLLGKKPD
jgi:hypothetical protein